MSDAPTPCLFGTARLFWRSFLPAWLFPIFFLVGGLASDHVGHPELFFWLIAVPLFLWSFGRPALLWFRGKVTYWPLVFWLMLTPFIVWVLAVYARLFVLHLAGASSAA